MIMLSVFRKEKRSQFQSHCIHFSCRNQNFMIIWPAQLCFCFQIFAGNFCFGWNSSVDDFVLEATQLRIPDRTVIKPCRIERSPHSFCKQKADQ